LASEIVQFIYVIIKFIQIPPN